MNRRLVLPVLAVAALAIAAVPATAKPKKTISKTYTATAPAPDPTNLGVAPLPPYSVCAQNVPNSYHRQPFKAPEAGSLKIELSGYVGDWDLLLMSDKGKELGYSGSGDVGAPEKLSYKFKKAGSVVVVACNWAGGPTGTVKYTFTYAK